MGRPVSFSDARFIKALPIKEDEAITAKELAEAVGCSRAKANEWARKAIEQDSIATGKPSYMGAITYYKLSSRPDNWMPKVMDKDGKYWQFDKFIRGLISASSEQLKAGRFKVVPWQVAYLWMVVLLDNADEPFSQANQLARANLIKEKAELTAALRMVNSILEDPFLSGNDEDVSMAYDAMKAMSGDITVEDVERVRDALR